MIRTCKQCGIQFDANYHNALFCETCAKARKLSSDQLAKERLRRERKMPGGKIAIKSKEKLKSLENSHAAEMGLTYGYYSAWKSQHPVEYERWLAGKKAAGEI